MCVIERVGGALVFYISFGTVHTRAVEQSNELYKVVAVDRFEEGSVQF